MPVPVLSVFTKSFDLDALCASWPNAPQFEGNSKKDMKVDAWLKAIEQGCVQRKVPKKYWHAVAQRNMGRHALERLFEVKKVMMSVTSGKFTLDWAKFEVAMKHMNWHIDSKRTLPFPIKVPSLWWIVSEKPKETEDAPVQETKQMFINRPVKGKVVQQSSDTPRSSSLFSNIKSKSRPPSADSAKQPTSPTSPKKGPRTLVHMKKPEDPAQVRVAHAPEWLLTACQSLDALSEEYPKTISVLAAVLIIAGSVPSTPIVAGTALATGTAHALGGLAVGLGTWLTAQQKGLIDIS